ncbi:hypothetical protein MINTM002_28950 [Mycobacterium intracellulare]|nr:hypothetical protein MINTM002_28950 [Mycobacterium intracellulare]
MGSTLAFADDLQRAVVHIRGLVVRYVPITAVIPTAGVLERSQMRVCAGGRRTKLEFSTAANLGDVVGEFVVLGDKRCDLLLVSQKLFTGEVPLFEDVQNNPIAAPSRERDKAKY